MGGQGRSIGGKAAETTATNDRSRGKFLGICVMHCHESTLVVVLVLEVQSSSRKKVLASSPTPTVVMIMMMQ